MRGKVTLSIRSAGNDLIGVPTIVHHSSSDPSRFCRPINKENLSTQDRGETGFHGDPLHENAGIAKKGDEQTRGNYNIDPTEVCIELEDEGNARVGDEPNEN